MTEQQDAHHVLPRLTHLSLPDGKGEFHSMRIAPNNYW